MSLHLFCKIKENSAKNWRPLIKILMTVKLFIILTVFFSIQAYGGVKAQTVSLSGENMSLKEVFLQIHHQTDYEFIYNSQMLDDAQPVSLDLKNVKLDVALKSCFKGQDFSYTIVGKTIVVIPKKMTVQEPKGRTVTGKVINSEDGSALPGVTIRIKGTSRGTITDINGNFSIDVSDNAVLVFSFVGFKTQEVAVNNRSVINIALQQNISSLNEVEVTAIGTTVKVDQSAITSSTVQSSSIVKSGEANIINSFSGKASGVYIGRPNGDPGAGASITIRGANTISGNSQPLIIIDGTPVSNNNIGNPTNNIASTYGSVTQESRLNDLNPDDIKSVQILKGAAAASVWGSRASNGVILITTKQGRLDKKPAVHYSYTHSFDMISVKYPLQTEYAQGRNGVWSSSYGESWGPKISSRSGDANVVDKTGKYFVGDQTGTIYYPIVTNNSNISYGNRNYDQVFQTGSYNEHNVSVSGGGQKTTYYIGLGRLKQDGIIRNSTYERDNFRVNTKSFLYKWLTFKNSFNYTYINSNRILQAGDMTNSVILGLYREAPDFDETDYSGQYVDPNGQVYLRQRAYRRQIGQSRNPIYNNPLWTINKQKMPDRVDHVMLSPELDFIASKSLRFIVRGGYDFYRDNRIYFFPQSSASGTESTGLFERQDIVNKELNFDAIGIYNHDFNKNFSLTATLGTNFNDIDRNMNTTSLQDFAVSSELQSTALGAGDPSLSKWEQVLIHTRINRGYGIIALSLFNQLYLNVSETVEASSTIKGNFTYPSFSAAWQFTHLLKSGFLSFGKLKVSWGRVGTEPQPYKFQTLAVGGLTDFGGAYELSSAKNSEKLAPEIKTEWDIGANLRFWKDRISLNVTYYNNKTTGILYNFDVALSTGYRTNYQNAAAMSNKGLEVDLDGSVIEHKNFHLSFNANWNNNRNNVYDIAGASVLNIGGTSKIVKGYPVSEFYLPGTLRDANGKMVLDANGFPQLDPNYRPLGNPQPIWRGGMGVNLTYKNLDFSILFEHSQGGQYLDRTRIVLYGFGKDQAVSNEITLTKALKNANGQTIPAGATVRGNIANFGGGDVLLDESWYRESIGGGLGFNKANDLYIEDATWTKLRNVTIGYTFKNVNLSSKFGFKSIRISVTGRDLILWTKVKGIDPETNNYQASLISGMNYFNSPGTRSVLFNLDVNL